MSGAAALSDDNRITRVSCVIVVGVDNALGCLTEPAAWPDYPVQRLTVRGLIVVMRSTNVSSKHPLDDQGTRIRVGDVVRVMGIPDYSRWTVAQRRFSLGVFRHIRGTCKKVASFDQYGFAEIFFSIRIGKNRGIHSVALEPYLLRVQHKRA